MLFNVHYGKSDAVNYKTVLNIMAVSIPWCQVHSPRLCLWWKKLEWEEFRARLDAVIDAIN